jgi:prephenate dehydratase
MRVGFQGELGAFSEEAVHELVDQAEVVPCPSFQAVVRGVEEGALDAGVLPVENTLAGTVAGAYDALAAGAVEVIGEVAIPIRHFLLGVVGASLHGLEEVRSHPVALSQCRAFFAAHPSILEQAVYDTAGAAKAVARDGVPTVAAIASRGAGERYGLDILQAELQDRDDNQTRFFLVSRPGAEGGAIGARAAGRVSGDFPFKTAWLAEVPNRPGSLHGLLGVFVDRGLDVTHVASRPAESPWTYRFILEFAHIDPADAGRACQEAASRGALVRELGTFVAWQPVGDAALDDSQPGG